jgi:hypothetical protein
MRNNNQGGPPPHTVAIWKLLSSKLILWGIMINPYDWCVTNKMIDIKQCTVLWYFYDLKISHVREDMNTDIIKKINDEFGKEPPHNNHKRKGTRLPRDDIGLFQKGKVKIKVLDYGDKMLKHLPAKMDGEAPSLMNTI